jgi:hypothetical protein
MIDVFWQVLSSSDLCLLIPAAIMATKKDISFMWSQYLYAKQKFIHIVGLVHLKH